MKNKLLKGAEVLLAIVLALVLLGGVALFLSGPAAQADAVSAWFITTVSDGATSYTGAQNLGGVYVANYGHVQIQVTSDVSVTTSTLTIVPQFSNDSTTCSSASNWFTATEPVFYTSESTSNEIVSSQVNTQTTTVVTNTSTITQEVGYIITSTATTETATPSLSHVDWTVSVIGDKTTAIELPVMGACMRLRLSVTNSDTYTPTIKVRMVNRQ